MVCSDGSYDYLFKICLIGDSGVGKTCLMQRYAHHKFPESSVATIGTDFCIRTLTVDNKKVKLEIKDTAGQERFRSVTKSHYRGADAVLLVYDVTDKISFDGLTEWLKDAKVYTSESCLKLIAGNKSDLIDHRAVSVSKAEYYAKALGLKTVDVSAKSSENVDAAFDDLVRELMMLEDKRREHKRATNQIGDEKLTAFKLNANPEASSRFSRARAFCCG